MTRDDLRAKQNPLKATYRDTPDEALVTLHAEGTLGDTLTCHVADPSTGGTTVAGLHPATGGSGDHACSGDMLLEALVACAGVTLQAVATSMKIDVRSGTLRAEATWDARGTLAVSRDAPIGLTNIRLHADLDTDADDEALDTLLKMTERYCVVLQTLQESPEASATWKRVGAAEEAAADSTA